ncbi:MAG: alpha/beta fold hydrolase [Blastocatellales bacterium]|nr:alpha/beta fold hydrolase [Blastocatellales bacterium]
MKARLPLMLGTYILLLSISHLVRNAAPEAPVPPELNEVSVRAVRGNELLNDRIRLAYIDTGPRNSGSAIPVLLLHGSPGRARDFDRLAPVLSKQFRLLIPDLPGFGYSSREIPDYSFRAHARYALQLLDELGVERAHVVGFSMGGGAALSLLECAPDRIASIVMLSAIGVQEMELLGDYRVNHAIHGLQLAGLLAIYELIPHFGLFDGAMLDSAYARNFFDSDQRPLRAILQRLRAPMLVMHGRRDFLVPVEAAEEHLRLVPHSEAVITDGDHFMLFTSPETIAVPLSDFFHRVEDGAAVTRDLATPSRVRAASEPLNTSSLPKAIGVAAVVFFLLLAAATLVSEDITCIAAGLMAGQGRISFALAAGACLTGIFVGDLLLFLAGRLVGRPAISAAPVRWFISPQAVARSSEWFARRGAGVIFLSRFVPGLRLPTYFAAGVLRTSFFRFALYFFLACLLWTPLLVGASMLLGGELLGSLFEERRLIGFAATSLAIYLLVRFALGMATWRGRRMLLGRWRRITRWEFWPAWIFYLPIVAYVGFLALKHRSLTLFTLANPAIPGGGFIGESKSQILEGLKSSDGRIATQLLDASLPPEKRTEIALDFAHSCGFPVVIKPDAGQRGSGVVIVHDEKQLAAALALTQTDVLVQEYAEGCEFGVFYYRYPDECRGRILAVTEKRFPSVQGDGRRTLEELILTDERAVCMAQLHMDTHRNRLDWMPAAGERFQLVELGTHCRGAVFLDGGWALTEELESVIDGIARSFDGFHFGRFDVRAGSVEDLSAGRNLRVIELNGVTSEATSIYDPRNSILDAYELLFKQWRIAFEIGSQQRARGLHPASVAELAIACLKYRKGARSHFSSVDVEEEER